MGRVTTPALGPPRQTWPPQEGTWPGRAAITLAATEHTLTQPASWLCDLGEFLNFSEPQCPHL